MTEKELVQYDKFYITCIGRYRVAKTYGPSISWKVLCDMLIREILRFWKSCRFSEYKTIVKGENWFGECLIYGGKYFIENWITIINEIEENLKYFNYNQNEVEILKEGFKYLKEKSLDKTGVIIHYINLCQIDYENKFNEWIEFQKGTK